MASEEPAEARFWREVEAVFTAVLAAGEDGREAALEAGCAGRPPALRRQVEAFLAAHARADGFMTPRTSPTPATFAGPAAADLPAGTTITHYEIHSLISRGGMGVVYRALDVNLAREVALKVLPPSLVADHERRRRFVLEARAAATLEHPHVAAVYEIGEADGVSFIAMELIRGETLTALLARTRMEPARALEVGIEVAEGLACAHERGIVHRDLKPGNIMLTGDHHAKIIDFGLVKLTEAAGDSADAAATEPGRIMGTVAYMSPELARGVPVDHRSDIFSFGTVLHEMLTGARPFRGRSDLDTLHAVLHAPAPRLGAALEDRPEIQRIVDGCLAKDPRDRYGSMKDVVADLRAAWLGVALATPAGNMPPLRHPAQVPPARKRRKAATVSYPAAERLYLRGRAHWNKRHPDAVRQAIALFQEALEVDPMHASAYAGLADSYIMLGFLQVVPPREMIPKARAAGMRAIELAPTLAEPHASLGYMAGMFEWDWPAAQRELTEAMRLNPAYPWAPHWYGLLAAPRSLDESLRYVTLARDLDPLSPIIQTAIGLTHHLRRDYGAALHAYTQILDSEAAFAPAHYYIGLTYEQMGEYPEATANLARAADIGGRTGLFLGALGHCFGISGQRESARAVLLELTAQARTRYVSPYNLMLVHLGLGDIDAALASLERALEDRASWLWLTPVEARVDGLRQDRRCRALLERYGLEA